MTALGQGIHDGVPMDKYIADPCPQPSLNKGTVKRICEQSPLHAHAYHPRLGGQDSKPSTRSDIGSALHSLILGGPDVWYIGAKDFKTKAAQAARNEARAKGAIGVLELNRGNLQRAADSAKETLHRHGITATRTEQTVLWEEGNGVWHRTRPDIIAAEQYIVDVKSSDNAEPREWCRRALFAGGYDLQAGLYTRGVAHIEGGDKRTFCFLAVEFKEPYACSIVAADEEMDTFANLKIEYAQSVWKRCLAADVWPGYGEEIHWAGVPTYLHDAWESQHGEADIPLTSGGEPLEF